MSERSEKSIRRRKETADRMKEAARQRNPLGLLEGILPDSPSMFSSLNLDSDDVDTHQAACQAVVALFKRSGNPLQTINELKPDDIQRLELERLAIETISQGGLLERPTERYDAQHEQRKTDAGQMSQREKFTHEEAVQFAWLEQLGADEWAVRRFHFSLLRRLESWLGRYA